jgi:hypothetical protein
MLNTGEMFVASLCRGRKVTNYYYYLHHPNPHNPHWRDVPSFFFHFWALFLIVSVLCSSPTELATLSLCYWGGVGGEGSATPSGLVLLGRWSHRVYLSLCSAAVVVAVVSSFYAPPLPQLCLKSKNDDVLKF